MNTIRKKKKKKKKRTSNPGTNNRNMQLVNMNGIWRIKICYAYNEECKKTNNGRNRTSKLGKNQNTWIERKPEVLKNIGKDTIK